MIASTASVRNAVVAIFFLFSDSRNTLWHFGESFVAALDKLTLDRTEFGTKLWFQNFSFSIYLFLHDFFFRSLYSGGCRWSPLGLSTMLRTVINASSKISSFLVFFISGREYYKKSKTKILYLIILSLKSKGRRITKINTKYIS